MPGMADQDHRAARLVVALGLAMHLGDQRAGRVDIEEVAAASLGRHRLRHAVRGEHNGPVVRHLVELVDEDRALGLEVLDDEPVVHDLMPHIDRSAVALDGALDDLDGAIDSGAEAAGAGEQDRERLFRFGHEKNGHAACSPLACGPADHCLDSRKQRMGAAP